MFTVVDKANIIVRLLYMDVFAVSKAGRSATCCGSTEMNAV